MAISLADAVQSTLDRHPLLRFQERQVDVQRAIKQQISGQFDTVLGIAASQNHLNSPLNTLNRIQAAEQGIITDNQASYITNSTFNAQKLLRSGIGLGPNLNLNRTSDNLLTRLGENRSQFAFTVTLPLLRNRGRDVVAAREVSAQYDVDASLYDVNQSAAELIRGTASAYWNHVAALRALDVAIGAEERAREVVDAVRTLIEADRMARIEVLDWTANLVDRTSSRIAAEQRVIEAKQALAVAMGLTADEMGSSFYPLDALPDVDGKAPPSTSPAALKFYIARALERRADYLATRSRLQSALTLVPAARNQLLAQLDMQLSAGYSGLKEGKRPDRLIDSFWTRVQGVDASVGITYSLPLENNLAAGRLVQARAASQQADLRSSDAARVIASEVVTAVKAVEYGMSRLIAARQTVASFREALEGQREKLRLGVGSPVDVLTIEDRLTNSLLTEVTAQVTYAQAVTQFRFSTGMFVAPDRPTQSVSRDVLFTWPFTGEAPP